MAAVPQVPAEVEQVLQGATDNVEPINPLDLLSGNEDLQNVVKDLAKHFIGLDKWVRRQEVIEARRQRFYLRNEQYILWRSDAVGFVPASGGTSLTVGEASVDIPRYTDVYNIYTPYGESLMSTLMQNPPGVNWQPEDPSKPEDIVASQTAEKRQQKIESDNDRKNLQSEIARLFYTDGRTVLYTRREGNIDRITAHGVLETKVIPITACSREELVGFILSDEKDVYYLKDKYKDYEDQIKEGSSSLGESSYERIARLGVLQGTKLLMQAGDAFAHMVTRHVIFLRPSAYKKAPKDKVEVLTTTFPDGMKLTFCGDTYCGSENISLDQQIAIGFPNPGDGMSRPSMGKRIVPLQDVFNDEVNLWHEAHDYCIPTLFMYSETGDIDSIREQISQPGNIVPFTSLPPGAQSAGDAFYAAVLEAVPQTLPAFVQFIQGPLAQFISGAFPALFGGDTGDNDTAKGIAIQRDQAMGRMGIPWGALQTIIAEAYLQAVMSAVKNEPDGSKFVYSVKDMAGNEAGQTISIDDLKRGSFKCLPDTDSSFPETTNQKRATYQLLMTAAERNPILAKIIAQPENQELGHEWLGLTELIVPGAEARNKQLLEITQLLKEPPVPPSQEEIQAAAMQNPALLQAMATWEQQSQQALAADMPPPPQPIPPELFKTSIPVDDKFDYHEEEFQTVKNWLSSNEKRREEGKGNLNGVQNVRLHGLAHEQMMLQQALQQQLLNPQPEEKGKGKNVGRETAKPVLQNKEEKKPQPSNSATGAQVM